MHFTEFLIDRFLKFFLFRYKFITWEEKALEEEIREKTQWDLDSQHVEIGIN